MLSVKPNQAGPSCHVSHCVTLCQPCPARPARYPSWRAHGPRTRIATGCMQSDAGTKSPGSVMRIASGIATRQSFLNNIRDSMSCSNFDLICGRVRKNAGSYCSCQKAVWTLSSDKPNLSTPENSSTVLKLWTFRRFSPHASSWRNGLLVCKTGGMEGFLLVTCGYVVHSLQILSYHSMSSSYPVNAYQR